MNFRCDRCRKPVSRPVWIMWRGKLSRVGEDCAERIRAEKAASADGEGGRRPPPGRR